MNVLEALIAQKKQNEDQEKKKEKFKEDKVKKALDDRKKKCEVKGNPAHWSDALVGGGDSQG